jgi:hypothetical protein
MAQDNNIAVVAYFVITLIVAWLVIYTAVRTGVGHALDRIQPRLLAEAHQTPDGVRFAVVNVGTGPAFDLSVRWSENPAGDPLARTPMLEVNGRLEWSVPVEPGSNEGATIRRLRLDWCGSLDPSASRASSTRAVLVPWTLTPTPS